MSINIIKHLYCNRGKENIIPSQEEISTEILPKKKLDFGNDSDEKCIYVYSYCIVKLTSKLPTREPISVYLRLKYI